MRTYIHAHRPRYISIIHPSVNPPSHPPISPCKTTYIYIYMQITAPLTRRNTQKRSVSYTSKMRGWYVKLQMVSKPSIYPNTCP